MSQVIGLKFRPHGQVYFFLSGERDVAKGDKVIVETEQGLGCAEVVLLGDETSEGLVAATRSRDDFWGDAAAVGQDPRADKGRDADESGPGKDAVAIDLAKKDEAEKDSAGTNEAPTDSAAKDTAAKDTAAEDAAEGDAGQPEAAAPPGSDSADGEAPGAAEEAESSGDESPDLKSILRVATPEDSEKIKENEVLAAEAYQFCRVRVRERKLDMKLVDVEVFYDRSKIIFYFTAPTRIDFRELVKDLVKNYRTRIELRQIGVRHETQMIGAVGNCGMVCCCRRFLRQFDPVTIKMAKEQNLFLNPTKISGICGRLLCCLGYEQANYEAFHRGCPKNGKKFYTNIGPVKVLRANLFRNSISLLVDGHEEREITVEEWPELEPRRPDQLSPEELKEQQEKEQERRSRGRGGRSGPPRGRGGQPGGKRQDSRKQAGGRKGPEPDGASSGGEKQTDGDRPRSHDGKDRTPDKRGLDTRNENRNAAQAKAPAEERDTGRDASADAAADNAAVEDDGAIFLSKPAYAKSDAKSQKPAPSAPDSGKGGNRDDSGKDGEKSGRKSRSSRRRKSRKPRDGERSSGRQTGSEGSDTRDAGSGGRERTAPGRDAAGDGDKPKPKRKRRRRPRGRGGKSKPQGDE